MAEEDTVIEVVARREAADYIRKKKLNDEDAELLLGQFALGKISLEQAMEYARTMFAHRDDTRTSRKPS